MSFGVSGSLAGLLLGRVRSVGMSFGVSGSLVGLLLGRVGRRFGRRVRYEPSVTAKVFRNVPVSISKGLGVVLSGVVLGVVL